MFFRLENIMIDASGENKKLILFQAPLNIIIAQPYFRSSLCTCNAEIVFNSTTFPTRANSEEDTGSHEKTVTFLCVNGDVTTSRCLRVFQGDS